MNNELVISSTIKESPAQRLGLERGDRLLKIDAQDVHDLPLEAAVPKLQGLPDTTVRLTIERAGKVIEVVATRAFMHAMSVESRLYSKGVGYIRITNFVSSTSALLDKQISALESANGEALKGIVLDLRDNGGGELREAVEVADRFLNTGLILSTAGRAEESEMRFLASPNDNDSPGGLKRVVLINGQTAAGAEMVAASLQDHRRAIIIGTTSQGFNTISTIYPAIGGLALNLITGEMIRPSGKRLSQLGVVPNICVHNKALVVLNPRQYKNPEDIGNACPSETQLHRDDGDDSALQAAVNVLLKKQ